MEVCWDHALADTSLPLHFGRAFMSPALLPRDYASGGYLCRPHDRSSWVTLPKKYLDHITTTYTKKIHPPQSAVSVIMADLHWG